MFRSVLKRLFGYTESSAVIPDVDRKKAELVEAQRRILLLRAKATVEMRAAEAWDREHGRPS